MRPHLLALLAVVGALLASARAGAQSPRPSPLAYAVVVGSNPGGAGQVELEYAEKDAERVAKILVELGGYDARRVRLLLRPDAAKVLATLDALKRQFEAHASRGEQALLFFYYSGHARADALNLGPQTLGLGPLRQRLTALPTTLTIAVLDACQSGAFSRAKGASRAADFSYNSMNALRTRGFAVMASSTEKELSQESDELRSSYFTHHFLVGLRGAGDHNRDGRVSLDEVYRYAYARTLAATTRTAVGGQHATLETELMGQGEVALTFPAAADAHLELGADFDGRLLLQIQPSGSVIAEVTKSKGSPLSLAVPSGSYAATVKRGDKAWLCELDVRSKAGVTLDLGRCSAVADSAASAKGRGPPGEVWSFDAGVGNGTPPNDAYIERLRTFGFYESRDRELNPFQGSCSPLLGSLGAGRTVVRRLAIVARFQILDHCKFSRETTEFSYTAYAFDLGARGQLDLFDWLVVYAQLELGPAWADTLFAGNDTGEPINAEETHFGFHARASAGIQLMPSTHFGLFAEGGYAYAPVIENEIGDVHDSGGFAWLVGVHGRTWGTP